jgi:hypothetical protein
MLRSAAMPSARARSFPGCLLVLIVAGCLATTTPAQNPDALVVRVRSLAMFQTPAKLSPLLLALPDWDAREGRRLDDDGNVQAPHWVAGVLESRNRAAIEAGRLSLEVTSAAPRGAGILASNRLVMRGRAADVDACVQQLDLLIAARTRPIEVTAWRLPLQAGPLPGTTWDSATLQQTLQRTPPTWTARARTSCGTPLRLAQERGIAILRDFEVEVAGDARITDPKCDVAFAGVRATVTAHAGPGDEIVLGGSWLLSEPVALHQQSIGVGQGSLDLPEHRTASVSFAGRVPNGGALVVAGRGADVGPEGFVLVLSARFAAPPPGGAGPDAVYRSVGALCGENVMWQPRLGWRLPGDERDVFADHVHGGGMDENDLTRLLEAVPPAEIDLVDGFLCVYGDADTCRRADALLSQLFDALRPAALHSTVATGHGTTLEVVQPVLADHPAFAFVGRERAVVFDHEVEIASKAQVANPQVTTAYSGLWLDANPCLANSAWHLIGNWSVAAHDVPRIREHAEKPPMTLQLVDYRFTRLPWSAPIAPNQDHELGDGPAWTAGGAPTRLSIRLSVP